VLFRSVPLVYNTTQFDTALVESNHGIPLPKGVIRIAK